MSFVMLPAALRLNKYMWLVFCLYLKLFCLYFDFFTFKPHACKNDWVQAVAHVTTSRESIAYLVA